MIEHSKKYGPRNLCHHSILAVGFLLLFGGATCPRIPDTDGARGTAIERSIDETYINTIECRKGDCEDWHRIRLQDGGKLRLSTRAVQSDESTPTFNLRLEDGFGDLIETRKVLGYVSQEMIRDVPPGVYLVGIEASAGSRSTVYELTIRFEPTVFKASKPAIRPKAATPEPPTFERIRPVKAEVLEVEGRMAEPTAVLLDLGRNRGVTSGMRGELRDADSLICEIQVVDVYDEGSRARLILPLRRAITPSVQAVLFFPPLDEKEFDAAEDEGQKRPSNIWSTEPDAFQPDPY